MVMREAKKDRGRLVVAMRKPAERKLYLVTGDCLEERARDSVAAKDRYGASVIFLEGLKRGGANDVGAIGLEEPELVNASMKIRAIAAIMRHRAAQWATLNFDDATHFEEAHRILSEFIVKTGVRDTDELGKILVEDVVAVVDPLVKEGSLTVDNLKLLLSEPTGSEKLGEVWDQQKAQLDDVDQKIAGIREQCAGTVILLGEGESTIREVSFIGKLQIAASLELVDFRQPEHAVQLTSMLSKNLTDLRLITMATIIQDTDFEVGVLGASENSVDDGNVMIELLTRACMEMLDIVSVAEEQIKDV